MAKAQHRRAKHEKRVAHQRIQKQRKLDAIRDTIGAINENGYEAHEGNMVPGMESRGYFYMEHQRFRCLPRMKFGDSLFSPQSWKRMPKPPKKKRDKQVPGKA